MWWLVSGLGLDDDNNVVLLDEEVSAYNLSDVRKYLESYIFCEIRFMIHFLIGDYFN